MIMPIAHILLAMLVAVIWGINFIFIKLGLNEFSPFFLCFLRFLLASVPAVFFIKPPAIPAKILIKYGLIMFALQFGFLFLGMNAGMTPGMASLIAQLQVFFSMFFAAIILKEFPTVWQITGALISFSGIVLVALHLDKDVTILGFICILSAAATWGYGNLITKTVQKVNMIALVVWGSFIGSFPMLMLSLIVEGPKAIVYSYLHMSWIGVSSLFYIVCISTWIGYGVWNWLISRHPISVVAPFTLLVPIVGMMSSVLIFDEPLQLWKLISALIVMIGLYLSVHGHRWFGAKSFEAAKSN